MRILQICSAKTIGGGERHAADLSNALAERGHDVFAALAPHSPVNDLLDISAENIKTVRLKNALDVFAARELARFAVEKKIDLMHAHIGRDYLPAAVCAKLSNKPFVLTRHVLFPMKRANRFFLRNASGVIAVSKSVAEALVKQKTFPAEKIRVIHNGIDTKRFSPAEVKNNSNIFRIGTIGELSSVKAHEILIEAAAKVLSKNSAIEFEIVGEDKSAKKETRAKLEQMIADLNLREKVKLRGWLDDVVPFLHSLDAYVSTSRFDAFGLSIVEAMSCGLPVISSDTEAAREIIADCENGILFPVNNSDVLAEKILNLLEKPASAERLRIAARERIKQAFSLEKMIDETEQFYREILNK